MTAMDGANTNDLRPAGSETQTNNAVLVGGTSETASPGVASSELPLIVWLQGDEAYFDQFSLNANEAMELIGIKRSRLTQISGKELRVGRKREGRYIKPYYRHEDVSTYKEWTRATASHSKSSNILEDAAKKLADRSDQLEVKLKEFWVENLSNLKKELGHSGSENLQIFRQFLQSFQEVQAKEFESIIQAFDVQVSKQQASLEPLLEQTPIVSKLSDQFSDLQDEQAALGNSLRTITSTQSQQSDAISSLQSGVKHLAGLLEIVLKTQKELLVMVDPSRRG